MFLLQMIHRTISFSWKSCSVGVDFYYVCLMASFFPSFCIHSLLVLLMHCTQVTFSMWICVTNVLLTQTFPARWVYSLWTIPSSLTKNGYFNHTDNDYVIEHLLDIQEELRHLIQNCGAHRLRIKFFIGPKMGWIFKCTSMGWYFYFFCWYSSDVHTINYIFCQFITLTSLSSEDLTCKLGFGARMIIFLSPFFHILTSILLLECFRVPVRYYASTA